MFSRFDKAWAALVGAGIPTALAMAFPIVGEIQTAATVLLPPLLTWLVPNKGA